MQIDFPNFESFLKCQLLIKARIMNWNVQVLVVFPHSWFICEYCPLGTLLVSQLISHIWFLHPPIGAHQICFAYVVISGRQPFPYCNEPPTPRSFQPSKLISTTGILVSNFCGSSSSSVHSLAVELVILCRSGSGRLGAFGWWDSHGQFTWKEKRKHNLWLGLVV